MRRQLAQQASELVVLDMGDDATQQLADVALRQACECARKVRSNGGAVLVACWGGHNRAPSMAVALLLMERKLRLTEAVADVVRCRGGVLSNDSFRRQLAYLDTCIYDGGAPSFPL